MTAEVRFAESAQLDLLRLHEHLIRRAEVIEDLSLADRAVDEIEVACLAQLSRTPALFRRASGSPTRRELVIPFGATGYVALYEIASPELVLVLAVRNQLEEDYLE